MRPIVFLHIPKTAGQTIHDALVHLVGGAAQVSPVRVHSQRPKGPQMPPGHALYSGHIDWTELDTLPPDRFAFTVLRDPRERIASFYFYLRAEAQALSPADLLRPENLGKRVILGATADDYFFGGDAAWQSFLRDHYDNFYVSYLATRRMRGRSELDGLSGREQLRRALDGADRLDGLYEITALDRLEADLLKLFGAEVLIAEHRRNVGVLAAGEARWPRLLDRLERDGSARRLEDFVARDEEFLALLSRSGRLGRTDPPARPRWRQALRTARRT